MTVVYLPSKNYAVNNDIHSVRSSGLQNRSILANTPAPRTSVVSRHRTMAHSDGWEGIEATITK
jgi:hypothetical protein